MLVNLATRSPTTVVFCPADDNEQAGLLSAWCRKSEEVMKDGGLDIVGQKSRVSEVRAGFIDICVWPMWLELSRMFRLCWVLCWELRMVLGVMEREVFVNLSMLVGAPNTCCMHNSW